jgi:hypothetical protein
MTPEIHAAAGAVAEARLNADRAAAASVEAAAHRDQIRGRIAALEDDRSKIATERKGGLDDPAHGARLAVIAVDLDGLGQILAKAHRAAAAAGAEVEKASRELATAEHGLSQATDTEMLRRFGEHANDLDRLLLETTREISALAKGLGRRDPWSPSRELHDVLNRLHLTRDVR